MIAKLTDGEALILRGVGILMRATFSPHNANDPRVQLDHVEKLKADIGPWLFDYAASIESHLNPAPIPQPDAPPLADPAGDVAEQN